MVSHMALEDEYVAVYVNEKHGLSFCRRTKRKDEYTLGRSYTHYKIGSKVYKRKKAFLEAIKDVEYLGDGK